MSRSKAPTIPTARSIQAGPTSITNIVTSVMAADGGQLECLIGWKREHEKVDDDLQAARQLFLTEGRTIAPDIDARIIRHCVVSRTHLYIYFEAWLTSQSLTTGFDCLIKTAEVPTHIPSLLRRLEGGDIGFLSVRSPGSLNGDSSHDIEKLKDGLADLFAAAGRSNTIATWVKSHADPLVRVSLFQIQDPDAQERMPLQTADSPEV